MYRKSFSLVITLVMVIGIFVLGTRLVSAIPGFGGLPSSYDPHISVPDAVKTSKYPLLVEFYTDQCSTCRIVTPWMHQLSKKHKKDYTFVMVDINNPDNQQIAEIFGVPYVPIIYVFDFKHMAKAQVDINSYNSMDTLDQAIAQADDQVKAKAQLRAQ